MPARHGCTASAFIAPGLANRSCCSRDSGSLIAPVRQFLLQLRSLVLRSFAPPALSGFLATTASADFSSVLTEEISPGKVQTLSPRAVRLYLVRLDDLWASLFPASLPPAPGLTVASCSYGRGFAPRFFQLCLAATPCGSLRLPSSAPVGSFHPTRFCPCWAHWGGLASCAGLVTPLFVRRPSPCRLPIGRSLPSCPTSSHHDICENTPLPLRKRASDRRRNAAEFGGSTAVPRRGRRRLRSQNIAAQFSDHDDTPIAQEMNRKRIERSK